uniref:EGF-like domain-containing protein n=1 Tax=Macrostomum lignano TaxID=282301 RepID=A0A1I8J1Q8_9PLAT
RRAAGRRLRRLLVPLSRRVAGRPLRARDPCALLRCDPPLVCRVGDDGSASCICPPGGDCETPPPGISLMDWLVPTLIALGVALVLAGAIIGAVMLRSRLRAKKLVNPVNAGSDSAEQREAQEMTERPISSQQGSERAETTAQDADVEEVETAIDGSTDAGGGVLGERSTPLPVFEAWDPHQAVVKGHGVDKKNMSDPFNF